MDMSVQPSVYQVCVQCLYPISVIYNNLGSKTRERKNNDTKDRSFDVASSLLLVAVLSQWTRNVSWCQACQADGRTDGQGRGLWPMGRP
jgi:hypothetical protein